MTTRLHICLIYCHHKFCRQKIPKCFTIEQPKDTPIVFAYEILDAGHKAKFTLHYGPTANTELLIMTRTFTKPIGHIDYVTDNDGVYSICLDLPESEDPDTPAQSTRLKLSINYGYDAEYYEKLSKKKNFEVINMEVHKLNDMMIMTLNEADYQKHKEVDYHTLTERMNIAALWWPMVQVGG